MPEWYTAYCVADNPPPELEVTIHHVYERKDFELIELPSMHPDNTDENGETIEEEPTTQWKYLERVFTREQYENAALAAEKINLRHETDIIDEYTETLMEEGVI